jgi:hypothetical protein
MAGRVELGRRIAWIGAMILLAGLAAPVSGRSAALEVTPPRVRIGAFFRHTWIRVTATIPAGCEAVIEVVGRAVEEDMMLRGRRLGLWMNIGEVDILGAPRLYFAASTRRNLLTRTRRRFKWGYPYLARHMAFKGRVRAGEAHVLSQEFFDLKMSQKLYGLFPGALTSSAGPGGQKLVQGRFRLPSRIATGDYQVHLIVLRNRRILFRRQTDLKVDLVGFPALLSNLAYKHSFIYGLLALVIAFGAGLLIGVIFKGGRKGH